MSDLKKDATKQAKKNGHSTAQSYLKENKPAAKIMSCQMLIILTSILTLVVSILLGAFYYEVTSFKRIDAQVKYMTVLENLNSYKWFYVKDFLSNETSSMFRNLAMNGESLSTVVEENKNVESAGEAVLVVSVSHFWKNVYF